MTGLVVMALLGVGLMAFAFDGLTDDSDETANEPPPEPDVPDVEDREFAVGNGDTVIGTDGDDTFTLDTEAEDYNDIEIDALAGDDLIALSPETVWLYGSRIDGGEGDDTIRAGFDLSEIDAGPGDDSVFVANAGDSTVHGGAGDDNLIIDNRSRNTVLVDGGEGNDTLDGTLAENANQFDGGPGDDLIIARGWDNGGTGYAVRPDGGEGADTIRFDVLTNIDSVTNGSLQTAAGGAGADTFQLAIDEGGDPVDGVPAHISEITQTEDTTYRIETLTIEDFEPGVDTVILETSTQSDDYTLSTIALAEVAGREGTDTEITLTYENPESFTRDVVIILTGATGVSWDDFELDGADRSVLVPASGTPPTLGPGAFGSEGDDIIDHDSGEQGREYALRGGNDSLVAGSGDDTITADGGINSIQSGAGNDAVYGGDDSDDRDSIWGGDGNDTIFGRGGNDLIVDSEGANLLDGGAGHDSFVAGSGSTITGGEGGDRIFIEARTDADTPFVVTDFDRAEDVITNIRTSVSGVETGNASLVHRPDDNATDVMFGDRLLGTVMGATPEDLENTEFWTRMAAGGTFTDGPDGTFIRGSEGADTIDGAAGDDTIFGGANLVAHGDVLRGGAGDDILDADGAMPDAYRGLDRVPGVPTGPTKLDGGPGDDILLSEHRNQLTGGEGEDVFGIAISQYGAPQITDFTPGEDVIWIEPFLESGYWDDVEEYTLVEWEDGTGADLTVGSHVIARIAGGQTLSVDDIRVAQNGLGVEFLGHH